MQITYKQIVKLSPATEKIYRRNYKNSRQTAKVARILNQVKAAEDEFEQVRNKWVEENAPDTQTIDPKKDPELARAANDYMRSLLAETVEIESSPAVKYEDLDKFEKKDQPLAADEMDALITFGLLDEDAEDSQPEG